MSDLTKLRGLGPKRMQALANAGITDISGLLNYLPRKYINTLSPLPISQVKPGETCLEGHLLATPTLQYYGGRSMVRAKITDSSGVMPVIWFNQPWMAKNLKKDQKVLLYGAAKRFKNGLILQNPKVLHDKGVIPQYKPLPGLPSKVFSNLIDQVISSLDKIQDPLPEALLQEYHLCGLHEAMLYAHRPKNMDQVQIAERRLAFENLLFFQLAVSSQQADNAAGPDMRKAGFKSDDFWEMIPFKPTGAQRETLRVIYEDMKNPVPMRRLVQGDVGSGKTAVAFGAAVLAIKAGYQCALMAPTELLARQHHNNALKLLAPFNVSCGLLLGGMKAQERRETLEQIADGTCQLIIGTHAVISKSVNYQNLGLAITDEQHRFGVRQRQSLAERADEIIPHILALSATPIPRSLALVLYGDLKISVMDELPPGRTPVKTRIVPESKRRDLYQYIRDKALSGEQSYLVCPLVTDSEDADSEKKSAVSLFNSLMASSLKEVGLALTYGSQKEEEKNRAMEEFYTGKASVLISTTVIEVGVDVPNATTMVIEDAENFGLSQLHQLRGRVGRGDKESWCFLLGEENERLRTLTGTNDGFEIAKKDLEQRGPGELLGTRQHGRMLNVYGINDIRLVDETSSCLEQIKNDPKKKEIYEDLKKTALERFEKAIRITGLQ
ncbi:MAG: ATP-dependent DNA helicase RecG [Bacillota bacterium]|nr:ATP-dependent DNA helicase RecG [Bacillota bacterium]